MRRLALAVVLIGVLAWASDDQVVIPRDGGADPSWPMPAVIRYDLTSQSGQALKQCYRLRRRRTEMRVAFEVGVVGISNFRVIRGSEGAFSECLKNVLYTLPTRTDGGTETVNMQFGESVP